jgi:hypothetical protein
MSAKYGFGEFESRTLQTSLRSTLFSERSLLSKKKQEDKTHFFSESGQTRPLDPTKPRCLLIAESRLTS